MKLKKLRERVSSDTMELWAIQASAYSAFARGIGPSLEQQKRRMDSTTNEPLFTNCTRDFIGTIDYIFYTGFNRQSHFLLQYFPEG